MKTTRKCLSVLLSVLLLALTAAVCVVPASAVRTVQFGSYPQTEVMETSRLRELASNAGWKSYDYYSNVNGLLDGNMQPGNWMQFADFFDGENKYRAVKIRYLRPGETRQFHGNYGYSWQDDNGYIENRTYYFKYEPLVWRVLSGNMLLCESIIDAQPFQNVVWKNESTDRYYQGVNSSYFANRYDTSSIRAWLNYDFYETAFNESQKSNIKTTSLSDAATNDNVFLLSKAEVMNAFPDLQDRTAQGTDYAKCQGLWVEDSDNYKGNSSWMLRSASTLTNEIIIANANGVITPGRVYAEYGVRPSIVLVNYYSDGDLSDTLFSGRAYCDVSLTAAPADGGSVSGAGTYVKGTNVTVTATPNTNYIFLGWFRKNGTRASENPDYRFYLTEDTALRALFVPKAQGVQVFALPEEGGTVTGGGSYLPGSEVTVTATPNEGYRFFRWFFADGTVANVGPDYTFTMPNNRVPLVAAFLKECNVTLRALPATAGTCTGGGVKTQGQEITISATPRNGWVFLDWVDAGTMNTVSTNQSETLTVEEDLSLYARFLANITLTAEPAEGGDVFGDGAYAPDRTISLRAQPNIGYRFEGWYLSGTKVSDAETYSCKVLRPAMLTAKFVQCPTSGKEGGITWTYNAETETLTFSGTGALRYFGSDLPAWYPFRDGVSHIVICPGVTGVGANAFPRFYGVLTVTVPESLTHVGENAFVDCDNMETVNYNGSEADWNKIGFEEGNAYVTDAEIIFHTAPGTPENPGGSDPTPAPANVCHWCGKTHEGFFQKIIGFFHNIMAKIFGAKY